MQAGDTNVAACICLVTAMLRILQPCLGVNGPLPVLSAEMTADKYFRAFPPTAPVIDVNGANGFHTCHSNVR